jgi:hypothetical protein
MEILELEGHEGSFSHGRMRHRGLEWKNKRKRKASSLGGVVDKDIRKMERLRLGRTRLGMVDRTVGSVWETRTTLRYKNQQGRLFVLEAVSGQAPSNKYKHDCSSPYSY